MLNNAEHGENNQSIAERQEISLYLSLFRREIYSFRITYKGAARLCAIRGDSRPFRQKNY